MPQPPWRGSVAKVQRILRVKEQRSLGVRTTAVYSDLARVKQSVCADGGLRRSSASLTEEGAEAIGATLSAITAWCFVFLSPPGREWRRVEGGDDKAGEMMGCRCPSPTFEDEQLQELLIKRLVLQRIMMVFHC